MIDCLFIGFNDPNFQDHLEMVATMGLDSGAYRDLNLAFIEHDNKAYRSMDILNHFHFMGREGKQKYFNNADFIWPVITYLGSYISKRGFTFDYVNLFHLEKDKLAEKLKRDDILTIAITTTVYVSVYPIIEIINFIKQHNTKAKILIGGPFIFNQSKTMDEMMLTYLLEYLGGDIYVISAEGEQALTGILTALKKGTGLEGINNIAYRDGKKFVMTPRQTEDNKLEQNLVDYTVFPRSAFGEFVSLRTSKSCPFACSFCAFPERAGAYVYTGIEHVERDLDSIREIGTVTTLSFIDDTFNVPKGRFKDLLRMMIKNNYGFKWNSFYRSDQGDEETIELMARSGCEGVFLGIESGSDAMLERMNKTSRQRHYLKAIPLLKQAGINVHANFIIGFPGETTETAQETIDFIEEAKPDFFRAQLWYADPATPIWRVRDRYGVKGEAFAWAHDTMDSATASDWIDKIFLTIEGSTWLPQWGFDDWSLYYLQRKGMTMTQIKTFVSRFNDIIKQKLIDPRNRAADPAQIEALKQSCQFNDRA